MRCNMDMVLSSEDMGNKDNKHNREDKDSRGREERKNPSSHPIAFKVCVLLAQVINPYHIATS